MYQILTISEQYSQRKQMLNAAFLEIAVIALYVILPTIIDII